MKILLISANMTRDPFPVYPLGMATISAALKEHGHTVEVYDPMTTGDTSPYAGLETLLRTFQPGLIGLAIRNVDSINRLSDDTNMLAPAMELSAICKRIMPETPLLLGGGGFTLAAEPLMQLCHADYGIIGPGEHVLPALIRDLEQGKVVPGGLLYGNAPESTPRSADYPESLLRFYNGETHMIPVQTKRGCPFQCVYCSYPALEGRMMRFRPPEETAEEIRMIGRKCPGVMVFITDSIFNDPQGEYEKLLDHLDGSVPFAAFLTPYRLTERLIRKLAEKGMISAELGIDGACDRTLQGLGKNFTFRTAAEAAELLQNVGISVTANFLFGGPGETLETVEEGIANIQSLSRKNMTSVIFSGVRILPHTPLYDLAEHYGMIPDNWVPSDELYYLEPGLDAAVLDQKLMDAFAADSHCIYPPHSRRDALAKIHKFGFAKMKKLFPAGVAQS